jgi:hypothetical protein
MAVDTASYRVEFRPRIFAWYSGWAHFALTNLLLGGSVAWLLSRLSAVQPWEWVVVPVAFLYANLVEYVAHRFPLHRPVPGLRYVYKAHAIAHHRFFTGESDASMACDSDRDFFVILFGPQSQLILIVGLGWPVGLFLGWLLSANAAYLGLATALGYFLMYEWLHLSYHLPPTHPIARLPGLRTLRRHHLRHHELRLMSRWNFNITFPLVDVLLRTRYRDGAGGQS